MIFFETSNENYINTLKLARQSIESTYDCKCDVIEYQAIKNSINKRTEHQEIVILEKQPCRISYKTIANANESEDESNVTQIVKLFIAPETTMKPRFKNNNYKKEWFGRSI